MTETDKTCCNLECPYCDSFYKNGCGKPADLFCEEPFVDCNKKIIYNKNNLECPNYGECGYVDAHGECDFGCLMVMKGEAIKL